MSSPKRREDLRKEDSKALQGFAVLIMIIHHYFLDISVYPANWFTYPDIFQKAAWACRMCVGIFSFVSGYGMYCVLARKEGILRRYGESIKRLLLLYLGVLAVVLVCIFLANRYLGGEADIHEIPGNITGFAPTFNGAFWYVTEYLWFMILAPVYAYIADRKGKKPVRAAAVIVIFLLCAFGKGILPSPASVQEFFDGRMQPLFLLIFTEGFFAAALQKRAEERNEAINREKPEEGSEEMSVEKPTGAFAKIHGMRILPLFGLVITAAALYLRYFFTVNQHASNIDIIAVPLLCMGATLLNKGTKVFYRFFGFYGVVSVYLWLIHNPVYDRMAMIMADQTGYWAVFVISLAAVSIVISSVFAGFEHLIKRLFISHAIS